ncbi:fumarylacetoacetate hydrolase family protein [Oceanobacillus saliphilus]|uniref:fumarylacetoacetate hydrolase family protein n=1 Tax=Oceanobacillus saliphilus TaxID=2925834 RepID=UPI00201DFFE5|nr:fumarylacetoacetate hydrolase family protein [Oceanobacillus saliphilus]
MKLVTYRKNNQVCLGTMIEDKVVDISNLHKDMNDLIKDGDLAIIEEYAKLQSNKAIKIENIELLSPITSPIRNIICIGWNYLKHFEERYQQHIELSDKPTVFTKATTTVAGPYRELVYSDEYTKMFDYEAELAVVIGREGKGISEEEALDYIFGYMCANDLSARDIQQQHGGQWFMGKSIDESCPLGPWLVTKDEIEDIQNLDITCKVNGEVVQKSNTSAMIFPVATIISELSMAMTLLPGDIILTGTPSGIGVKRKPQLLLGEGDVVEVEIENIGSIKNTIRIKKELRVRG